MSTRTAVGTYASRVIDDARIPNSVKTGLQRSLIKNGELVDHVLEEMLGSIGVRIERMFDYASRGEYLFGLPSGQYTNGAAGTVEVEAVLAALEGDAVAVDYVRYGAPNSLHIGWMGLVGLGYDFVTNQIASLTASVGTTVYLDDLQVVVPASLLTTVDNTTLAQWGTAACAGYTPERTSVTPATREIVQPSPPIGMVEEGEEHLLVSYIWQVGTTIHRGTVTLPITGYDGDTTYFHAKYSVGGITKWWMYRDGAGTHPTLDALFDRGPIAEGTYFPFIHFRYNKYSEIADTAADTYKAGKRLCKYLGVSYDQIAEGIDANPDIDKIDQAILMLAVPANSSNPAELRYLWQFFNNMFLAQDAELQYRSPEEQALSLNDAVLGSGVWAKGIVIQDTRFKMALEHAGIYKRRVAGSIGAVGTYAMAFSSQIDTVHIVIEGAADVAQATVTYHRYRRQVSGGFYDEITLVDLHSVFHTTSGQLITAGETQNILLVPLDHSITSAYSISEREALYARALHLVFNAKAVTHLKWYEEEWFHFVLLVVMIVLTVMSQGATASELVALLAAGEYAAAAWLVLTVLVDYAITVAVFRLFVKAVGLEVAFFIAVLAAVLGVVDAMNAGSLSGAPFAADLLQLATGIAVGIGGQIKSDLDDLASEQTRFEQEQAELYKLLESAQALLDQNNRLSPFLIFGETPQEYYARTVHSGNIGIVGIAAISHFVDAKLRLPKLNDSFGEFDHA